MVFTPSFQMKINGKYNVFDVPINRRFLVCERDAERPVNAVFLIDGSRSLQDACQRHGPDFRHENTQIGMPSNVYLEIQDGVPSISQTVFVTLAQKSLMIGSDRSGSHGLSLSEHSLAQ